MSRPIAYNASGPLSGSIRGGSVNYTVDSGNRDYTTFASKKWVPSADGAAPIVFVTDSYTQGFQGNPSLAVPLFYSCNGTGSAAILYTANRIPGSPGNYSDANVALSDLITARGYFILESNDPFEGVDADSLALDVDASKMSSYPQVGTNWRDLSGNSNTGTLYNSPTWDSKGWFVFDGTDDYVDTNSTFQFAQSGQFSVCGIINVQDHSFRPAAAAGIIGKGHFYANSWDIWLYNDERVFFETTGNSVPGDVQYLPSDPLTVGRWYFFAATYNNTAKSLWINGVGYSNTYTGTGGFTNGNNVLIARRSGDPSRSLIGSGSAFSIYSRELSTAEIKQNYFGAPIVTDGLVFAVDANNIVSYPKSGTSWYSLTGSNVGALTNSPTFNQENGGSIKFDGTDDYVNVPYASNQNLTSQGTISVWINPATVTQGLFAGLVAQCTGGSVNMQAYSLSWRQVSGALFGQICNGSGTYDEVYAALPTIANVWYNIVFTWNGSQLNIYNNGAVIGTTTQTINSQVLATDLTIGGFTYKGAGGTGEYFNGKIANVKLYNRGFTAAEVLQNYQAEQYRFETPAGPVTNGLVLYWDAGNLDSYPGTGTTIYDLSGNGNNGTLYNGVGYNQTNGGVLTFDGVDDYGISYNPNLQTTTSTVMGAARYSGATRGRMINSTDVNWLMGHWNNSTENYYAEGWVTPVQTGTSDTNWRIYAALGNQPSDAWSLYVNNTVTATSTGGSSGPDGISIGAQTLGGVSEYSTGQFSFVLVYNRVLTTAEMTQNYNYFKGRFGL